MPLFPPMPEGGADERLESPTTADGRVLWRIARDSRVLDLNSSYSYVLWCRDFAATSLVARSGGEQIGFVTGYLRPERPDTLFIWQVATCGPHRGTGVAGRMLDELARRCAVTGARFLETTITPSNTASDRLFTSFARRHGIELVREVLFPDDLFPDAHEPELLYRIGPLVHGQSRKVPM